MLMQPFGPESLFGDDFTCKQNLLIEQVKIPKSMFLNPSSPTSTFKTGVCDTLGVIEVFSVTFLTKKEPYLGTNLH